MALPDQQELQAINQIAESLSSSDRRRLFYLCESLDADDSMGRVKETLKSRVLSRDRGGRLFLEEVLLRLKRFDILRKVCRTSRDEVERSLKHQQLLPRFRVLMDDISEDMACEDVNSVKFLLSRTLPREKMERAKDFLDVIIELEKLDFVSPERVHFVEDCLKNISRFDLAKKVTAYQLSVAAPEQHSPQPQRCRDLYPSPSSSHYLQSTRRGQFLHIAAKEKIPVPLHIEQRSQSSLDRYKFNSNPRGVCVIIDCVGHDGDMLEQTFKALHFTVVLHKLLNVDETLSALREVFKHIENLKGDGFVCCIISRGTANNILGTDSNNAGLCLDSVRRLFTASACPMMAGKPKLFFIQNYSVPSFQPPARMHHRDEDLETDGCEGLSRFENIPTDADVFWSHCRTEERQLEQGHHRSIYLKTLTDALLRGQRRETKLVDIHTEVNGAIFEHYRRNPGEKYHIDLRHTLRKDLYLL